MPVRLLDEKRADILRAAALSYIPQSGLAGQSRHGYDQFSRSVVLTRRDFDAAARDLFEWQMHSRAGLDVLASEVPLEAGTVVLMRWGLGALSVGAPLATAPTPRLTAANRRKFSKVEGPSR